MDNRLLWIIVIAILFIWFLTCNKEGFSESSSDVCCCNICDYGETPPCKFSFRLKKDCNIPLTPGNARNATCSDAKYCLEPPKTCDCYISGENRGRMTREKCMYSGGICHGTCDCYISGENQGRMSVEKCLYSGGMCHGAISS